MVTARIASRCSPSSASSAMKRRRSKLVLAPEATATSVLPRAPWRSTQALAPAIASAPAGSSTTRVSSNTSLIAAHIASVSASTISSTSSRHRRNVSRPTCFTATPSANSPTFSSETRSEEHTSELQSQSNLVCRLLLEKKKKTHTVELGDRLLFVVGNVPTLRGTDGFAHTGITPDEHATGRRPPNGDEHGRNPTPRHYA